VPLLLEQFNPFMLLGLMQYEYYEKNLSMFSQRAEGMDQSPLEHNVPIFEP
jgi:hypothetical protein